MRLITGVLVCASTGWLSLSLADPPAASSARPAASGTQSPGPASPAAAAVSVKLDAEPDVKALRAQGYKPEMVRGEKLYCRNEAKLGSHFEQKVCGTVDQLKAQAKAAREMTENSQRHQTSKSGN